jgi:hypothetical protein
MGFVKTIEGVSKRVIPQKMFPEELEMCRLLLQLPTVQGLGYVGWRTGRYWMHVMTRAIICGREMQCGLAPFIFVWKQGEMQILDVCKDDNRVFDIV